ncbi:MAG: hypothetical protein FMNOHCHN_03043 [Ignavibacteriaceae bacterium]|nr:hypothetical protein [Ignavibacteriaceae bacterium]
MGQQQLLLIVLGVIIVGISVVVGINLFQTSAVQANRDAVIADLNALAASAMQYYKKPANLGGGGNSFSGYAIPTGMGSNANGTYTISVAGNATGITFQGVGTEKGDNGSSGVTHRAAVTSTGAVTITKTN